MNKVTKNRNASKRSMPKLSEYKIKATAQQQHQLISVQTTWNSYTFIRKRPSTHTSPVLCDVSAIDYVATGITNATTFKFIRFKLSGGFFIPVSSFKFWVNDVLEGKNGEKTNFNHFSPEKTIKKCPSNEFLNKFQINWNWTAHGIERIHFNALWRLCRNAGNEARNAQRQRHFDIHTYPFENAIASTISIDTNITHFLSCSKRESMCKIFFLHS